MADHRVIGVERDPGSGYPRDPHVRLLCLEDGQRIPRLRAITNIKYGVASYHTDMAGVRARVRVVGPCSRCGEDYLRADDEATLRDTLLTLPECGPETPPSASQAAVGSS
jgi:hypothetical protein